MLEKTSGINFYGVKKHTRRSSNLEIMLCGFPREKNYIWENLRKDGLVHSWYNIAYPTTQSFFFLLIVSNQTPYWLMLTS